MVSTAEQLSFARQQHLSGAIATAEQIYREVLQLEPHNVEALDLAGVAAHQSGRQDEAIELLLRAVAIASHEPSYHIHLGAAFVAAKRFTQAEASFREGMRLDPLNSQIHYNLATLLSMQSRQLEAEVGYREALRLQPNYPEAYFNLGNLFVSQEQFDEAITCFDQALQFRPNYLLALNNLGNIFNKQGRSEDAVSCFSKVLQWKPDQFRARNNLGVALVELGRFDEAAAHHAQVLASHPTFPEAHNNMGVCHYRQGQLTAAIDCYDQAIAINPDYAEAHTSRGIAWLMQEDFARGWKEYEWRWKSKYPGPHRYSQPRWDGSALQGRTILLHAEQGLGDTLQFIRYAPLVKACGGTVVVCVPAALLPILKTVVGIDYLVSENLPLPHIDVQAPLLSLPEIMGTTAETIPATVPYLEPVPDLVDRWRGKLQHLSGMRIGIQWQGRPRSTSYQGDMHRAIPLDTFEILARVDGLTLVSLQKGACAEQVSRVKQRFQVHELESNFDSLSGAFMDTAAVMKSLDLVITSDTAVAHLAGGLGVPVWVALPSAPDWRWLGAGSRSRWYPTMRLFRQTTWGDWHSVFTEMAEKLQSLRLKDSTTDLIS